MGTKLASGQDLLFTDNKICPVISGSVHRGTCELTFHPKSEQTQNPALNGIYFFLICRTIHVPPTTWQHEKAPKTQQQVNVYICMIMQNQGSVDSLKSYRFKSHLCSCIYYLKELYLALRDFITF